MATGMKDAIVNAVSTAVWLTDRLLRRTSPDRRICLYYHEVTPRTCRAFERQMDALLRWSAPFAIDAGARATPPARGTAVTFDDAYADTLAAVAPMLRRRRIPCLVFAPTGSLGRPPAWIADARLSARCGRVASAEELRRLPSDTFAIGSHAVSHPRFPELTDADARRELVDSKTALEAILGRPVPDFSFPHGRYTARDIALARATGYERVFTIEPGFVNPDDPFLVRRIRADPAEGPWSFRLKLGGAHRWRRAWRRHRPTA